MTLVAVWQIDEQPVTMYSAPPGVDLQQYVEQHLPYDVLYVDHTELPTSDNDFYNAWKVDASAKVVMVDIVKARELTKERLRVERKPLLEALDLDFMKALETGQSTTSIVAEKQRLRDITLLADACTTLSELRALKCKPQ